MKMRLFVVLIAVGVCTMVQSMAEENGATAERAPVTPATRDNYTIQLQGGYMESAPLNLIMTGSGPKFTIALVNPTVNFSAELKAGTGTVDIKFDFSSDILIKNGVSRVFVAPDKQGHEVSNVEVRRYGVVGSAVLEDGKPLAIVTLNQKKLELTVTKCKATTLGGK